jgi:membrane fusion protein (multidrug efflux system)
VRCETVAHPPEVALRRPFSLLLLFLLIFVAACGRESGDDAQADGADSTAVADSTDVGNSAADDDDDDDDEEEEESAIPVEVVAIGIGPIETVLRATATLEAETQVRVVAEASRRVVELLVEEGDLVKRGQLLARLQDAEQASALSRARTVFEQADREWTRQQSLKEKGLTTDREFNDALATMEQRRIEVNDAERELGYTRIRATVGGTVTQRFIHLGDQVNPGTELFEIIDFASLVALIYMPEQEIGKLTAQQPARIHAPAIRPEPFMASVDRVSPIVDARTGTVKVTVDIGGQPGLRPGLYVDVELVTAREDDALLVPKRAVLYENDRTFVFRIVDGRARRVELLPAMADVENVRPVSGFAVGDTVVVAGQASLKEDALVEIVERDGGSGS